jgi:hypothetical protein
VSAFVSPYYYPATGLSPLPHSGSKFVRTSSKIQTMSCPRHPYCLFTEPDFAGGFRTKERKKERKKENRVIYNYLVNKINIKQNLAADFVYRKMWITPLFLLLLSLY